MSSLKNLCRVIACAVEYNNPIKPKNIQLAIKKTAIILNALFASALYAEEQYCYIDPRNIAHRMVGYMVARGQWKKSPKGLRLSTLFRILIYYNINSKTRYIYI